MRTEASKPAATLAAAVAFFMNPERTGTERRLIHALLPGLACRYAHANKVWCRWAPDSTPRTQPARG